MRGFADSFRLGHQDAFVNRPRHFLQRQVVRDERKFIVLDAQALQKPCLEDV
jgi:hypothetical protein